MLSECRLEVSQVNGIYICHLEAYLNDDVEHPSKCSSSVNSFIFILADLVSATTMAIYIQVVISRNDLVGHGRS